jgi:hypothetical protein
MRRYIGPLLGRVPMNTNRAMRASAASSARIGIPAEGQSAKKCESDERDADSFRFHFMPLGIDAARLYDMRFRC